MLKALSFEEGAFLMHITKSKRAMFTCMRYNYRNIIVIIIN